MDIIYLDEVLFLNALTDYLLLLSAALLRSLPLRRGRFALGAVLGAVYAALGVLPGWVWLQSPAVMLAVSLAMSAAAYGTGAGLWRSWAVLLALSAAFGGAVLGVSLLAGQGYASPFYIPLRTLLMSFGLFYALLRLFLSRILEKQQRPTAEITVVLEQKCVHFTALRDTGNTLFDPVTGLHVLIAEQEALLPLLPLPPREDPAAYLRELAAFPQLCRRFRLLPYRAVGSGGLLVCFRPESITVDGREESMLVGLSPTPFAEHGEFKAIV